MADTLSLQTRSSSLRHKLRLEKHYMNERLRAASIPDSQNNVRFNTWQSYQHPSSRVSQVETPAVQEHRTSGQRQRRFPLQTRRPAEAQLVIDVNASIPLDSAPPFRETQSNMKTRRSSKHAASSPPSVPYSSTVQASPTPVSGGSHGSVCQSPSWEAYDRRKQEKKEEKKLKDEAKSAKKHRRLSKAPPTSCPQALTHCSFNQSEPAIISNSGKSRPTSMVLPDSPSKNEALYKQPRSRAGSFSSLLMSTFDFRRSSIDQSQESPFIGGIKLEFEQHLANERESQPADDQSDIHPALRNSYASSTSALGSPTLSGPNSSKTPNSRAYPPNTFRTTKSKSMLLVSPATPALPDLSTIEKWRARVGLRPSRKSLPSSESLSQSSELSERPSTSASSAPPVMVSTLSDGQGTNENNSSSHGAASSKSDMAIDQDYFKQQVAAPEPPPRSLKRNNTVNGSPPISPRNTGSLRLTPTTASSSVYELQSPADNDEAKETSISPSWENLQNSVLNTIENTIKPMGQVQKTKAEQTFWSTGEWPLKSPDVPQMTSTSSEDSVSDFFNTVSIPSTPNTSRPQSEKGASRFSIESDRRVLPRIELHDNAYPIERCSFVSTSSLAGAYDTDREADAIKAAARKVMAALPPVSAEKAAATKRVDGLEPLKLRTRGADTLISPDVSLSDLARQTPKNSKVPQLAKRGTGDTIAKVFVECCGCKYYHDLPSKLYEAMVNPSGMLSGKDGGEFAGAISTTVKCPWCKHAMSTSCCAGLAAMVYVKERLH